jgi:hypothetical protein
MLLPALLAVAAMLSQTRETGPRIYVLRPTAAAAASGAWLPRRSNVGAARAALLAHLREPRAAAGRESDGDWSDSQRPIVRARIDDYALQFAGVRRGPRGQPYAFDGHGARLVLINGICRRALPAFAARIATYPVAVADGGACFFQAVYNPRTDRIVYFSVNSVG